MKNFITLNDLIAELQKIAVDHGEDEVLSIGACSGQIDGLNSPFSVNLKPYAVFYVPSQNIKNQTINNLQGGN